MVDRARHLRQLVQLWHDFASSQTGIKALCEACGRFTTPSDERVFCADCYRERVVLPRALLEAGRHA